MGNNTWKNIVIATLVLLNGFALYTMWQTNKKQQIAIEQNSKPFHPEQDRPPKHHDGPPHSRPPLDEMFKRELQFTDGQVTEFNKLKQAHHESIKEILEETKTLKEQFFNTIGQETEDTREIALQIGENQTQIELLTHKHFTEVRVICDKNQKEKFDNLMKSIAKRMDGPPPKKRGE